MAAHVGSQVLVEFLVGCACGVLGICRVLIGCACGVRVVFSQSVSTICQVYLTFRIKHEASYLLPDYQSGCWDPGICRVLVGCACGVLGVCRVLIGCACGSQVFVEF